MVHSTFAADHKKKKTENKAPYHKFLKITTVEGSEESHEAQDNMMESPSCLNTHHT